MNSKYETKVFQVHTEGDRFGFTLAGEYPCQLVRIQNDSPAERAGLVCGDEVLEVNGINMTDLQHNLVASFICPSSDGLTEFRIGRWLVPFRHCQTTRSGGLDLKRSTSEDVCTHRVSLSDVVDRVVEEFQRAPAVTPSPKQRKGVDPTTLNGSELLANDEDLKASFSPETSNLNTFAARNISTPLTKSVQTGENWARKRSKIQAVLGYLGSIDSPMTSRNASGSLVTTLRVKKDLFVTVLLEVSPVELYLRNTSYEVILTSPTSSLAFVGMCRENKQIFGLFTSAENSKESVHGDQGEINSDLNLNCVCHLFEIKSRLTRHSNHKSLTDRFHMRCNSDPSTGNCQQFPTSSFAILNAIYMFLRDSTTQIPLKVQKGSSHITSIYPNRVTGLGCPVSILGESSARSRNNPSTVNNISLQAEKDDSREELVLCLHLHPLSHLAKTREQEMDTRPPHEFNSEKSNRDRSTVSQNSFSITSDSASEITTSSTQSKSLLRVEQSDHLPMPDGNPQLSGQETESPRRHKTLIHRRSRSLASNVKNTLHACQATQTNECYSQTEFRLGNGGRPLFHSSTASVAACNIVNSAEGKVARWAVGFDRLLEDTTGVDIFRTFLQKEYSEENLIFWLACKKYKTICDEKERKIIAEEIYENHLMSDATLPVNVENSAIREVEMNLQTPTTELFATLHHQIYTLMKFDSYTRFLKSELYRQYLVDEMEGRPLPMEQDDSKKIDDYGGTLRRMFGSSTKMRGWKNLNKSQGSGTNETDESKKKSFLPWRGRTKSDQIKKASSRSSDSQASGSRSSLSSLSDSVFSSTVTNSDETLNDSDGKDQVPPSCRVILPNRCLMYLFCKSTRSLQEGLAKLCEKKEYSLAALDLFVAHRKLTKDDLQKKLTRFINKDIVLKEGVLFRLQLPSDRSIGVKTDWDKTIDQVLEPILRQSSLDINDVTVRLRDTEQPLKISSSVSSLHKSHVIVNSKDVRKTVDNNPEITFSSACTKSDEDSVFDAIMSGKRQSMDGFSFDENGVFVAVVKPAGSKEYLLTGSSKDKEQNLSRSPAFFRKKKRDGIQSVSTFKTFVVEDERKGTEELFSLLRRSQNSRIDDQRGLLNKDVELPDFLKLPSQKPSKRSSVLDVGVPSARSRHPTLKKTISSPSSYVPFSKQPARTHPTVIAEQRPREACFSRNLSGSLLNRGKSNVCGQTQTIDRKRFMNKTLSGSRLRSGSLPPDNPDERFQVPGGSEVRGPTRYQYGSELSFENTEKHVVWVSNTTNKNRQREGHGPDNPAGGGGDDEERLSKAEVVIPDSNSNVVSVLALSGVGIFCERPKQITDSMGFREFVNSNKLHIPTADDGPTPEEESTVNDRETILDNSFLKEHLKPSRLFSQLSPEAGTPLRNSSPTEDLRHNGSTKCPIFSPSSPNLGCSDSPRDDPDTDDFPYDNLILTNLSTSRENHARSANASRDTARHVYWGTSEMSNEDDSVRVTFV